MTQTTVVAMGFTLAAGLALALVYLLVGQCSNEGPLKAKLAALEKEVYQVKEISLVDDGSH